MLPKPPYILLSFVNAQLRDQAENLSDLCAVLDVGGRSSSRPWRGLTIITIQIIINSYLIEKRGGSNYV